MAKAATSPYSLRWRKMMSEETRNDKEDGKRRNIFSTSSRSARREGRPQDGINDGPRVSERGRQDLLLSLSVVWRRLTHIFWLDKVVRSTAPYVDNAIVSLPQNISAAYESRARTRCSTLTPSKD